MTRWDLLARAGGVSRVEAEVGRWAAGEEARAVVGPGGAGRARALLQKRTELLHGPGIEPGPPAWQARILPLNHRCVFISDYQQNSHFSCRIHTETH